MCYTYAFYIHEYSILMKIICLVTSIKSIHHIKAVAWIVTLAALFTACTPTKSSLADKKNYTDDKEEYRRKYNITLDSAEKVIRHGYYYVVSTVPNSAYRVRVFHPDEKLMTEEKHYSTPALTLLHGEYKSWWDDGAIREQGFYQYGRKHGIWLEKEAGQGKSVSGEYLNHRKEGIWTQLDTNGMVESVHNYLDGKLHGKFMLYDASGEKINEGLYRNDTLIAELFKQPALRKPYLKSCNHEMIPDVHACTDVALPQFFYSELRYPQDAKKYAIEGTAVVQWDVAHDGSIQNIRVPQSLSTEIKNELIRVVKEMPGWVAADKSGRPSRYTVTVPVNFSL